jgi:hypothetical protein
MDGERLVVCRIYITVYPAHNLPICPRAHYPKKREKNKIFTDIGGEDAGFPLYNWPLYPGLTVSSIPSTMLSLLGLWKDYARSALVLDTIRDKNTSSTKQAQRP